MVEDGWGSVTLWTGRLAESTAKRNLRVFKPWMKWVALNGSDFAGYTPDMLVEYQRAATNSDIYTILDKLVIPYIQSKEGTHGYLSLIMGTMRSFFLHNRAALPKDEAFRIKATRPPVRGDLKIEDIRKLILSSKPVYQAIFTSMFMGGMDQATFVYWNATGWPDLRVKLKDLAMNKNEAWIHRINVPGRKAGKNVKPFYTFIGRDALKAIDDYVKYNRPDGEPIFTNKYGDPISKNAIYQYWNRNMRKIGILSQEKSKAKRTGKNPHELRDAFRSRWRITGVDVEVAEFLMGHDIDKLGYDKSPQYSPDWFEEQYEAAMSYLNIMSEDPENVPRKQIRKEQNALTERITDLEEQLRLVQEYMRKKG